MPNLSISCSKSFPNEESKLQFLQILSQQVCQAMGKSELYMMVNYHDSSSICFAGDATTPAAFCQFFNMGELPAEKKTAACSKICEVLEKELQVPSNRIYVVFQEIQVRKTVISSFLLLPLFILPFLSLSSLLFSFSHRDLIGVGIRWWARKFRSSNRISSFLLLLLLLFWSLLFLTHSHYPSILTLRYLPYPHPIPSHPMA